MQHAGDRPSVCRSRCRGASARSHLAVVAVAIAAATLTASAGLRAGRQLGVLVGQPQSADRPARGRGHERDDAGPGGLPGRRPRHRQRATDPRGQPVRVLDAGDPAVVRLDPAPRRGGRAGRSRRRPERRDAAPRRRRCRGHVRPVAGLAVRPGHRLRGVRQGCRGQPRADGEHRPRPAVGTVVRDVHRGPVPKRVARDERDRRRSEHRRDVAGQALRGLQPGDQSQHAAGQRDDRCSGR